MHLRDDFKGTDEYKYVYRRESFDNWDLAINTLESWNVLLPEVVQNFRDLKELRNRRAIHFNIETDTNDKGLALEAIGVLLEIVKGQFAGFGTQPWFIPGITGAAYVKKEYEENPFVKRIILPNCALVGSAHRMEHGPNGWIVMDNHTYEERDITDEEFADLLEKDKKA
jgi:hypothetical protein